jgi:hypothetical protein
MILDTVKKLFGYKEPEEHDEDIAQKKVVFTEELRRIENMVLEAKLRTRDWTDDRHDKPA